MLPRPASPPAASRLQRSRGAAEIGFALRDGATRLVHLFQSDPCRVLLPDEEPGDPPQAVVVTTSGGLTGGDAVRLDLRVGAGGDAIASGQAAEKIYRAVSGQPCAVDVAVAVEDGATLEWLPQETILFDGARLERRTTAELGAGARLLACEMVAFGRGASGERFSAGRLLDRWTVRRGGAPVWIDAIAVDAPLPEAAGFAGANACAMALYAADDSAIHLAVARTAADALEAALPGLRVGATVVNGVLVARVLGEAEHVRRGLGRLLVALRQSALGRRAALPRVWLT